MVEEHSVIMTGDTTFSPGDQGLSPHLNLDITIEEGSNDSEQVLEDDDNELGLGSTDLEIERTGLDIVGNGIQIETDELENESDQLVEIDGDVDEDNKNHTVLLDCGNGVSQGKGYLPPFVGMEFETYDDAYNYYNCYARELGFAIRVKSSWTKRNSKEKRGAVLCCNCEGFKMIKEANSRRKETRTGCLAMIRLRLVESNRWRVDEVKIEHNHTYDSERAQNSKSHKKMDAGSKRKAEPTVDVEVRTIKLYRAPAANSMGYGSPNSNEGEISNHVDRLRRLKLQKGDAEIIHNYFSQVQLTNPNFMYLMDLNDEGCLRNVFWIDSRSRSSYAYFGDVVAFDTTCLSNKYEIPLIAFVGVNHHGQSIQLGCSLLADQTFETYIWLFRTWLTCMCGRPPQTIVTDMCKVMQSAITEVFPRAHHRLCLPYVMRSIRENVVELQDYHGFQTAINRIIFRSLKVDEFEMAWEDTVVRFGLANHEWLRTLYEDREKWAPVYLKDTFFAGISTFQQSESIIPFFDGYLHQQTSLKEFFDLYELVLQKKRQKEAVDDFESRNSSLPLKTRSFYELQLSEVYTNEIFRKFQEEVVKMSSCFSITQLHANGPIVTYLIKEREGEVDTSDAKSFEIMYDKTGAEVRCICSSINFNGYLCRHALCILNYNGVEELPFQYILSRWRKDIKRVYVPDLGPTNIDITNPVQWFDHLYRRAMQVVEEGMKSQDHYTAAWQAFNESLNKVRLVTDRHL